MSGYDICPGCLGRKSKVSQLCMSCTPRTGANGGNWRGGPAPCPDCSGKKATTSKRCQPCAGVARRKFTDPGHVYGREWQTAFRLTPQGKLYTLAMNLKKFGFTPESYEAMVETQGRVCAACGQPESTMDSRGKLMRLSIDHDHTCCPGQGSCGKCVRGLLCNLCNRGLGLLGDSEERLEALLSYMRRAREVNAHNVH